MTSPPMASRARGVARPLRIHEEPAAERVDLCVTKSAQSWTKKIAGQVPPSSRDSVKTLGQAAQFGPALYKSPSSVGSCSGPSCPHPGCSSPYEGVPFFQTCSHWMESPYMQKMVVQNDSMSVSYLPSYVPPRPRPRAPVERLVAPRPHLPLQRGHRGQLRLDGPGLRRLLGEGGAVSLHCHRLLAIAIPYKAERCEE
jgi:hypothetical protein